MAKKSAKESLPAAVHIKARWLMEHEGKTREQAYGAAAGMYAAGRLTKGGKYIRARRGKG